ncbi:hypothetical protein BDP81DRAFT_429606 [Colletotrichum phormii]|uniref:Zn(2)-C6 fungal-type domain-containing protein n=1 Tax=Colletotrichum phormii TaxID=359342 RepID=A0AAI9ZTJ1_9PEZI|nr:uncharacterized protein BDP81DRAFT_429606 [Colletotrichum phormii]KAK1636392.1 hypothetical protein BDP81DRAFT_429606 [Colletotrichum phormii]
MDRSRRSLRDRANIVCVECHSRKVKYDLQASQDKTCRNCRRAQISCVLRNGVRKRRPRGTDLGGTDIRTPSVPLPIAEQMISPRESPREEAVSSEILYGDLAA